MWLLSASVPHMHKIEQMCLTTYESHEIPLLHW